MNLKQSAAGASAALVIATGLLAVTTVPASAGDCTGNYCGGLFNNAGSERYLAYTMTWDTDGTSVIDGRLKPGTGKGGYGSGVDVDGFYIPKDCFGTSHNGGTPYREGWWKINDASTFDITVNCY
jgi:hypothetical protein